MRASASFLFLLAFSASIAAAENLPSYQDAYVDDFANVLDAGQAAELRALFSALRANTTAEVVFVSLETTAPDTPAAYRTLLFNAWGIGDKEKDNGLLILYAKAERRIEVEVGYGLEGILSDSKVGRLLDETYVPARDAGETPQGIVQFANAASAVIAQNADEVRAGKAGGDDGFPWPLVIFFIIFFLLLYISIKRGGGGYVGSPGFGGGWRGSGGSFGGGGGFGGGGSGGGGAGR